jgi:Phosphotransferase enzyme family
LFASPAGGHGTEIWSSPSWREAAVSWLDEQLEAAEIERTGEVEQPHLRPWANVLKVPTSVGPVWLKAAAPTTASEVRLYDLLQRVSPEHALKPIAADLERGWVLLPDGGPSLGETLSGGELADALTRALPEYGRLQRKLVPHADELVAMGLADMRPEVMPRRFDEAFAAAGDYVGRHGSGEDRETLARVDGLRQTYASWCERLALSPVPASLDHNDLHPWNILVGADGCARFYDFGDGVVAHPFSSMLLGLGWFPLRLGIEPEEPAFVRARDSYLEAFSDLAPHPELVETLELACRVGKVARALTWERAIRELAEDGAEHSDAPFETMGSLLDESYLGRT